MEYINNDKEHIFRITEAFQKVVSVEKFSETVNHIFEYFNAKVNKVNIPIVTNISWEMEHIGNIDIPCATFSFPASIEINAYSVISATFSTFTLEEMKNEDVVHMRLIETLVHLIVHELSHAGQRVDYLKTNHDFYKGDKTYYNRIEDANEMHTIEYLEENLDKISEEFGFELSYRFENFEKETDMEYEELTLLKYYRQIMEIMFCREFESDEKMQCIVKAIDNIESFISNPYITVRLSINGKSIALKEVDDDGSKFVSPVVLNEFMYENFTQYQIREVYDVDLDVRDGSDWTVVTLSFQVKGNYE